MAHVLFISGLFENLGIEYLSTALKKNGHSTSLLVDPRLFNDCYNNNRLSRLFNFKHKIIDTVKQTKPNIICLSVLTDTLNWALEIASLIKQYYDIPIIFGGIHPTLVPETVIGYECVDMLCVGDGEQSIVDLADCLSIGQDYRKIKNLWVKDNQQIVKNDLRDFESDLDRFGFPDKSLYYEYAPFYSKQYLIMTSRGCDYNCLYCCNHALRKILPKYHVRRRTVSHVMAELENAKKNYFPEFIWFMDDLFASNTNWLEEFSLEYQKKIKTQFFCYLHPNDVSKRTIDLLEKMGCREIGLGVQSINEITRKQIQRLESVRRVNAAIELISKSRIVCCAENIIGLPHETEDSIQQLAEFYNQNRPDIIVYSSLKVFPKADVNRLVNRDKENCRTGTYWDGESLARGGNVNIAKKVKKAASFLPLIIFLPKSLVSFIVKKKIYRLIPKALFLHMPRIVRFIKRIKFPCFSGKNTYDAGAQLYINAYKY